MSIAYIERLEKRLAFERQRTETLLDCIDRFDRKSNKPVWLTMELLDVYRQLDAIDAASDEQADDPTCWGGDSNAAPLRTGPA